MPRIHFHRHRPGRLRRCLAGMLVRLLAFAAPRFPRGLNRALAWVIGHLLLITKPEYARIVRANLSVMLDRPVSDPHLRRTARRIFVNFPRYIGDLFHYAPGRRSPVVRDPDRVAATLRELLAEGRGLILLTAHLGNWELGAAAIRHRDVPISVVYRADRYEQMERERRKWREHSGVGQIEIGETPMSALPALHALSRGEILALQGDRDPTGQGRRVPFAGRQVSFPIGPALLSLASGAPILPIFVLFDPDGGYRIQARAPIRPPREAAQPGQRDREAALRDMTARIAEAMEYVIRRYPDQWYCLVPFFEEGRENPCEP